MIRRAIFPDDQEAIALLFRAYQTSIGVDLCFQSFSAELENLEARYATVFLLEHGGEIAGCAALAIKAEGTGEMKRLYVTEAAQGNGYGKALMEEVLSEARCLGFRRVVLDTIANKMPKAVEMYRRRGFVETGRHTGGGHELLDMELTLED